jgi:type IV pilus assembly protein PilV
MKNKQLSTPQQQAGVMLLEVLVGMMIFMIGVLGLIGLQAKSITQSMDAATRSQAAFVAQEFFSQMEASLPTTARTSQIMLNRSAVDIAAPTVFNAWNTNVLQSPTLGLPNASATYVVIQDNNTVAVELNITWQLKVGGTGPDATVAHRFITRKPFI